MSENTRVGVLDVDLGNSAMKYRFGDRTGAQNYAAGDSADAESVNTVGAINALDIQPAGAPSAPPLARIRVCSVLGESQNAAFQAEAYRRWGVEVEFARSVASAGGVTNGYRDAATLGVDRWMAVLAAYQRAKAATLVIDLGTAITLDYVDDAGTHNGGYIVPGTRLMQEVLLTETAAIQFSEASSKVALQPGGSTQEAVSRGALVMVRNMIEVEVERFRRLCHHAPTTFLCGGGAPVIAPHLSCRYELVPDLVLDGLSVALP